MNKVERRFLNSMMKKGNYSTVFNFIAHDLKPDERYIELGRLASFLCKNIRMIMNNNFEITDEVTDLFEFIQLIRREFDNLCSGIALIKFRGKLISKEEYETIKKIELEFEQQLLENPKLEDLWSIIKHIISDRLELELETIHIYSNFRNDLQADSLDSYELIYAMEEELSITIPDEKANELDTVKDGWDYLLKKLKEEKTDSFLKTFGL